MHQTQLKLYLFNDTLPLLFLIISVSVFIEYFEHLRKLIHIGVTFLFYSS
jgi:hypothetical protein